MVDTSDVKVEFILSHKVILSNVILIRKPFSQPSQKPFLLLTWEGSVQQPLIRGKPPQWPFLHSAGPSSAPSRTAHSYLTDISREYYGNHSSYRIGNDNTATWWEANLNVIILPTSWLPKSTDMHFAFWIVNKQIQFAIYNLLLTGLPKLSLIPSKNPCFSNSHDFHTFWQSYHDINTEAMQIDCMLKTYFVFA